MKDRKERDERGKRGASEPKHPAKEVGRNLEGGLQPGRVPAKTTLVSSAGCSGGRKRRPGPSLSLGFEASARSLGLSDPWAGESDLSRPMA